MKSSFRLLYLGFVVNSCFLEVVRASLVDNSICHAQAQHPFQCPAKTDLVAIDPVVKVSNDLHDAQDLYTTTALMSLPDLVENATAEIPEFKDVGNEAKPSVVFSIPQASSVEDVPEVPQQTIDPILPDASTAQFPSFEDWKRRASDRAGDGGTPTNSHQRKRTASWENFDEDGNLAEYDPKTTEGDAQMKETPTGSESISRDSSKPIPTEKSLPSSPIRSGDALKHSKERFNYASFDCAAIILSTNSEAKGSTAILIENKDQYMLNQCSAQKFVVVELCDEILVDTVALANYEFFSSMFKDFQISVSNRWPPKQNGWVVLAKYRARNSRDIQVFGIEEPQIFARYIRIDFLSHYGNEFYCPLSLLRVYGTTMMESYKKEIEDHQPHLPGETHKLAHKDEGAGFPMPHIPILSIPVFQPPVPYAGSLEQLPAPTEIASMEPHSGDLNEEEAIAIIEESGTPSPSATGILTTEELTQSQFPELGELQTKLNSPTIDVIPKSTPTAGTPSPEEPIKPEDRPHMSPPATGQSNGAPPPSPPVNPGTITQESIFKTIMKRLAAVEHNATLSHRYLEEQSKAYNQVFAKIEAMQRAQLTSTISQLNRTAIKNADNMNRKLKHLRDDLDNQQKKHKRELSALDAKLERLADEVVFEKRLGLVQLLLLLCVLSFIGASRFFKPPERVYIPASETYTAQQFIDSDGAKSRSTKARARRRSSERPGQMNAISMSSVTSEGGLSSANASAVSTTQARTISTDNSNAVSSMIPEEPAKCIPTSSAKKKKKRRGSHPLSNLTPSNSPVLSSSQPNLRNSSQFPRLGGQITTAPLSGSGSAIDPNGNSGVGTSQRPSTPSWQSVRPRNTNENNMVSDDTNQDESPLGHKRKHESNPNRHGQPLVASKSNDAAESSRGRSVKPPQGTGGYMGGGRKTGSLPNIYIRQHALTTKNRARPSNNFFDALSTP